MKRSQFTMKKEFRSLPSVDKILSDERVVRDDGILEDHEVISSSPLPSTAVCQDLGQSASEFYSVAASILGRSQPD